MHEGAFTEQIVATILKEVQKHPGRRPKSVRVRVGEVYHLVPESVAVHFEAQVLGTPLQGVRLDLQEDPMRVSCKDCGASGPVDDHHLPACPTCYSRNIKTISGDKIIVEAIELEA